MCFFLSFNKNKPIYDVLCFFTYLLTNLCIKLIFNLLYDFNIVLKYLDVFLKYELVGNMAETKRLFFFSK